MLNIGALKTAIRQMAIEFMSPVNFNDQPPRNFNELPPASKQIILNKAEAFSNSLTDAINNFVLSGTVKFLPNQIMAGVTTADTVIVQVSPPTYSGGGTGTGIGNINNGQGDGGKIY